MGARVRCAWLTSRTICASIVSLPTRSARITSAPVPFTVAPITRAPLPFSTGIDSPVIIDRKSTRLNSSHLGISYAVFFLYKRTEHIASLSFDELSAQQGVTPVDDFEP